MNVGTIDTRRSQMQAMLPVYARQWAHGAKDVPGELSLLADDGECMVSQRVKCITQVCSAAEVARVEVLYMRISMGCYHIDSLALARCILISETRFL